MKKKKLYINKQLKINSKKTKFNKRDSHKKIEHIKIEEAKRGAMSFLIDLVLNYCNHEIQQEIKCSDMVFIQLILLLTSHIVKYNRV